MNWRWNLKAPDYRERRRQWQPTPVFWPGESQGRGSLVGCRLWGRTESDTTEATQQQQRQQITVRRLGSEPLPGFASTDTVLAGDAEQAAIRGTRLVVLFCFLFSFSYLKFFFMYLFI